jgi:tellurite resistance protein
MTSRNDLVQAPSKTQRPPLRLRANLLGIAFGFAGLAQCWAASRAVLDTPQWIVDVCWALCAVVWVFVLTACVRNMSAQRRLTAEVRDPVFGPFTSLSVILPMMFGVALAAHVPAAGKTVYLVALVLTVMAGCWMSAWWITGPLKVTQWHPGYFLPTVAGGLLAANGAATLGFRSLGELMFGYGMVCWLVLGSIVLGRLFLGPPLPTVLLPTLAIEVAPPAVAGSAWLAINGDRRDLLLTAITGYGVLMVGVQVALLPLLRRVPFGPGWWAFTFSYAAVGAFGIRWLPLTSLPDAAQTIVTVLVLAGVTVAVATLAVRSLAGIRNDTFPPREPVAEAS